jgi:hypothetical protein
MLLETLTRNLPRLKFTKLGLIDVDMELTHKGWAAFGTALRTSPVTHLKLRALERLSSHRVEDIVNGVKGSKVTSLSYQDSGITREGIQILCKGLPEMNLNELNLGGCDLVDEDLMALAAVIRNTSIEKLDISGSRAGTAGLAAILEGVRDTAVVTLIYDRSTVYETLIRAMTAALKENSARSFVLQTEVEGEPSGWTFTFRTMGGNVAGTLRWSSERPARELPKEVFGSMKAGNFQLPSPFLKARNLRFVLQNGEILDCKRGLVQQLWSRKSKASTKKPVKKVALKKKESIERIQRIKKK